MNHIPIVILVSFAFSASMLAPAIYGFANGLPETARTFLYTAILGIGLSGAVGLTVANRRFHESRRTLLLTLGFVFVVLPIGLAVPVQEAMNNTTFSNAYLDMVSAMTTTALPTFDLSRLDNALILWRSQVAWMGGLMMWTCAWVMLMPMRLGGFEILPAVAQGQVSLAYQRQQATSLTVRFLAELKVITPLYVALTLASAFGMITGNADPFAAVIYAMGAVSTAGYVPTAPSDGTTTTFSTEVMVFATMIFALSRQCFGRRFSVIRGQSIWQNAEIRFAVVLVGSVTALLFARQFFGAASVETARNMTDAAQSFWGILFTAMSFLTTTGYASFGWDAAQDWAGLSNPAVILLALAMIGGGVATTAGGIKLLRMASLMQHSTREINQMAEPRRVLPNKGQAFGGQVQNAVWAWVFLMSFIVAFAFVIGVLAIAAVPFEQAFITAAAALSNTGPLVDVAAPDAMPVIQLDDFAKVTLVVAMVLGRVETLALIALLNPDIWRR